MDKVDLKLLGALCEAPRDSISRIAKKCRISQQVAQYRISRLEEQEVIKGYHAVINPQAFGNRLFRTQICFSKMTDSTRSQLEKYLQTCNGVAWAGFTNSSWDLIIDLYARNCTLVEAFMTQFTSRFPNISRFDACEITQIIEKKYPYLHVSGEVHTLEAGSYNITADDHTILKSIHKSARKSLVDISSETGLSIPTIRNRLRLLESKKIIAGYRLFCDPRKFGREPYKLIVTLQNYNPRDVDRLITFGLTQDDVIYIARYFGQYNVDFEVECKSREDVQTLIQQIRSFIPIKEIQIVSILEDIELNHYTLL